MAARLSTRNQFHIGQIERSTSGVVKSGRTHMAQLPGLVKLRTAPDEKHTAQFVQTSRQTHELH